MKKLIFAIFAIAFSYSALANDATFGKWRVFGGKPEDPPLALTANDSDNAFGQVCSDETVACYWMILSPKTPCNKGDSSAILVNSSSGANGLTVQCIGPVTIFGKSYHRYVLSPFEDVSGIVAKSSGMISFAMAVDGGSFTVMRFDLNGSEKAIAYLDKLKIRFERKMNSGSTKDISL
jgi:hypothetical protein